MQNEPTTMLHKIAQAMMDDELKGSSRDPERVREDESAIWLSAARAAVMAMREPSDEGYFAGYDATRLPDGNLQFADAGFCLGHVGNIWRAMIDKILEEG